MKNRLITILFCFALMCNAFTQNNAPIAVNDTIFVEFNESVSFVEPNNPSFYSNDSDPDGDNIFIDTALYTGAANFSFQTLIVTTTYSLVRFNYQPPLNYFGIDQIKYVLKDDGIPVMYDTATIYVFVKRQTHEQLNLNNINARIDLKSLFNNWKSLSAGFEVPKGNDIYTIFSANLWLAGKNNGNIYFNGATYDSPNESYSLKKSWDRSGPIMNQASYKNYYDYQYDRVWKITVTQIENHIANWSNSGYNPPQVFKDWPAHGNTNNGEAFYLAPFVDINGDGVYNPYNGDYPEIKGQQAVYFIYNDVRLNIDSLPPMQSEVHGMAYSYKCFFDSAINNTIFVDYKIYNRSNITYDSTYVGFWSDMDLGNSSDDYVGSDVDRGTYFVYNGDDNDASTSNANGYGTFIPAQSITFLKGAKQDNDGIDNAFGIGTNQTVNGIGFGDGIVDNEYWGLEFFSFYNYNDPLQGKPITTNHYYNYMTGKWTDGTPTVYGGNGHGSTGGTMPAKYMFPDSSDTYSYGTGGIPQASWEDGGAFDKRTIGSSGPFTFEPDSSVELTLAFVFGRNYQTPGRKKGLNIMKERVDTIISYYKSDYVNTCYIPPPVPEEPIKVLNEAHVPQAFSPNGDGNNDFLFVYGGPYAKLNFRVFDRWGRMVFSTSSQDVGWDGTYRGEKVVSGVYVYILTGTFYNDKSFREGGNITLVR